MSIRVDQKNSALVLIVRSLRHLNTFYIAFICNFCRRFLHYHHLITFYISHKLNNTIDSTFDWHKYSIFGVRLKFWIYITYKRWIMWRLRDQFYTIQINSAVCQSLTLWSHWDVQGCLCFYLHIIKKQNFLDIIFYSIHYYIVGSKDVTRKTLI